MSFSHGTGCIIDVRVTDTDAKSNLFKDPAKVLEDHEKEKKRKYLKSHVLSKAVISTNGLIGKEAKTLLKKKSSLLAEKWESIAMSATHLCLRGSRIHTSQMSNRRPQWEDKAGLTRSLSAFFLEWQLKKEKEK